MNQRSDAGLAGGTGDCTRACDMHGFESLWTTRRRNAHQIDYGLGARECALDRLRKTHVGLDRIDLSHFAKRLQVQGKLWASACRAHAPSVADKCFHGMATQKAGPAENRHNATLFPPGRHLSLVQRRRSAIRSDL